MSETYEYLVYVIDCDSNNLHSFHGIYDKEEDANNEAKRMNTYELANLPERDYEVYQQYEYKVEQIQKNYFSKIGQLYGNK